MLETKLESIVKAREALVRLTDESATVMNGIDNSPTDDSIAKSGLSTYSRPLSLKTAYDQSSLALRNCADHTTGFLKAISEPVEPFAACTLARGVIESGALSIWLGRPDIGARERVVRSLSFRFDGLRQQRTLARLRYEPLDSIHQKMERLIEVAKEQGIEFKLNLQGNPRWVGQTFPNMVDVCESELEANEAYRVLSAVAHSQPFGLRQLGFQVLGRSSHDVERVVAEKAVPNVLVMFLIQQVGKAFVRAVAARWSLYGYLNENTVRVLRVRCDEMEIPESDFRYCIWSV